MLALFVETRFCRLRWRVDLSVDAPDASNDKLPLGSIPRASPTPRAMAPLQQNRPRLARTGSVRS